MSNDIKNNLISNKLFLFYLKIVIYFFFMLMTVVAFINYKMDPAKIYHKYFESTGSEEMSLTEFTKKLVQSDNGIIIKKDIWNERDIVHALADYQTNAECAVFGSSQVMQISSARPEKSLLKTCSSLINLGLNGATIEDYIALSKKIFLNKKPPKTIIIAIHPWSLNFNRDLRWSRYKKDFINMQNKIMSNSDNFSKNFDKIDSYNITLLSNLINFEYFMSSIDLLMSKKDHSIEFAKDFNYNLGLDHKVLLPDGSLIYSSEHIKQSLKRKIDGISGNQNYKIIPGKWYNQNAIELLTKFVIYLKKNFNIVFVMTPYHPEVWNFSEQPVVTAMKIVELKVHEIAKSVGIQVIGSFDPKKINCTSEEFYDEMHPKDLCLAKLENVHLSY